MDFYSRMNRRNVWLNTALRQKSQRWSIWVSFYPYISSLLPANQGIHAEDGVRCAVTKSKLLFDADYSNLKAQDVLLAFEDDPRMVQIPMEEALDVPITKLSAKYSLVATNGSCIH